MRRQEREIQRVRRALAPRRPANDHIRTTVEFSDGFGAGNLGREAVAELLDKDVVPAVLRRASPKYEKPVWPGRLDKYQIGRNPGNRRVHRLS